MKWKKMLSKKIWEDIRKLQPDSIEFRVVDNAYTICKMIKNGEEAVGIAICSILDKFDPKIGANKAAGRAIKALKKKQSSEPVRYLYNDFPRGWTLRQVTRVRECPYPVKSLLDKI